MTVRDGRDTGATGAGDASPGQLGLQGKVGASEHRGENTGEAWRQEKIWLQGQNQ